MPEGELVGKALEIQKQSSYISHVLPLTRTRLQFIDSKCTDTVNDSGATFSKSDINQTLLSLCQGIIFSASLGEMGQFENA